MSEVILHVGAKPYGGWTSIEIRRTLEACAGAFSLGVTENWPGRQAQSAIARGDACSLSIDGEIVITGDVNDIETTYDKAQHEVVVRGRDRTGDLVDGSAFAPNFYMRDQTLLQVAVTLCQPFGINVRADVDVGPLVHAFALQVGETVFTALERFARHRGVLLVSDGQGGLLITRPGNAGRNDVLRLGANILSAKVSFSDRERFNHYIVLSQAPGAADLDAERSAGIVGEAFDPGIKRFRPLIVFAEEPLSDLPSLNVRAHWEATVREARGRRCDYTVQGWRDAAGALWAPNRLVRVDDDFAALHEDMLIAGVRLQLDDNGERAVLTVVGAHAFDVTPLTPKSDYTLGQR